MDDINVYNAQADTISVDAITSSSNNRIVLRRHQRNSFESDDYDRDNDILYLNQHDGNGICYVPEGAYDMGWLGYFVGNNEHLKKLYIRPFTPISEESVRDVMEPFFRGVGRNKSIRQINFRRLDLLGGEVFRMLGSFFKDNHNLTNIDIRRCDFGDDGARLFALSIGSSTNKSLQKLDLLNNNISDEGMVDIITALSMFPHLRYLDLSGNRLHKNGCVALATLLRCSASELGNLFITHNEINDDGIDVLIPALKNCSCLHELWISHNPSITTRGWQSLASILESPNYNLEVLYIPQNNVDDEAVVSFANALTNNHTLHSLCLDNNPSITAVGWEALSKLLCNTSSVNETFLSNHTLRNVASRANANANEIIGPLLELNRRDDKNEIATIKILQSHDDFDMLPFFEWEFKVLPMVLRWLERASDCEMPDNFEPNIERRNLSTIFQFVRGMPLLYVETRLRKELEDIKALVSQIEEEQLLLDQRRQLAQQRKTCIMRRLGSQ